MGEKGKGDVRACARRKDTSRRPWQCRTTGSVEAGREKFGRGRAWRRSSVPPSYIFECLFQASGSQIIDLSPPQIRSTLIAPFLGQFNYLIYTSFSLSSIEHNSRNIELFITIIIIINFLTEFRVMSWRVGVVTATRLSQRGAALTPTSLREVAPILTMPNNHTQPTMPSQEHSDHGTGSRVSEYMPPPPFSSRRIPWHKPKSSSDRNPSSFLLGGGISSRHSTSRPHATRTPHPPPRRPNRLNPAITAESYPLSPPQLSSPNSLLPVVYSHVFTRSIKILERAKSLRCDATISYLFHPCSNTSAIYPYRSALSQTPRTYYSTLFVRYPVPDLALTSVPLSSHSLIGETC